MVKQFECKACGGELEIIKEGIGRCTYCACKQPIPKDNEALFNRANQLRMQNKDFEEAYKIYKEILEDSINDPEVYWGMLLCRFGIEYVKDNDGKYLPTCHRTILNSILEDTDYLNTLKYADGMAIDYYKAQGNLIEEYQKKIKLIVANEDPYDVFISFKATDMKGYPTIDARTGKKIYDYLTQKYKLKVFFSNITLQDRLGEEFEPIIYAALKSSKVMVLISSTKENINSTWLKNEWSRYIDMIQEARTENKKKRLIPALLNMKMEELPSELLLFQGMDISKPSALEKLCENIDNFIGDERIKDNSDIFDDEKNANETDQINVSIKFANQKLREGDFEDAYAIFKDVASKDETLTVAHWGMLLARHKKRNDQELATSPIGDLNNYEAYKKAYKYADDNKKKHYEIIYQKAQDLYKIDLSQKKYDNRINIFISRYKNLSKTTYISESSMEYIRAYFDQYNKLKEYVKDFCEREKFNSVIKITGIIVVYIIGLIYFYITAPEIFCFYSLAIVIVPICKLMADINRISEDIEDDTIIPKQKKVESQKVYQTIKNNLTIILKNIIYESKNVIRDYNEEAKAKLKYSDKIKYKDENYIISTILTEEFIKEKVDKDIKNIMHQIKREIF